MNFGYIFLDIINLESNYVGAVAGLYMTEFFKVFLDVKSGKNQSVEEPVFLRRNC